MLRDRNRLQRLPLGPGPSAMQMLDKGPNECDCAISFSALALRHQLMYCIYSSGPLGSATVSRVYLERNQIRLDLGAGFLPRLGTAGVGTLLGKDWRRRQSEIISTFRGRNVGHA